MVTATSAQGKQILIVVDGLAGYLSFENARIMFMQQNEGFHQLAAQLDHGELSVAGFRIVILLIGRGDVWETDRRYFDGVERVINVIHTQNERCIIVLGATLPSTLDSKPMVRSFTFRNDKLVARCTADEFLEHARPGKHLLGNHGPIDAYYDGCPERTK